MKRFTYFLLLLLISATINMPAQQNNAGGEEKLISIDSGPSTFSQYDPKIVINPSGGFWIGWQDTRDGLPSQYLQRYNGSGQKYGNNFSSVLNGAFGIGYNGSYMSTHIDRKRMYVLGEELWDLLVDARISRPGIDTSKQIIIRSIFTSLKGTFEYLGTEIQIIPFNNHYLALYLNTNLITKKIDYSGQELKTLPTSYVYARYLSTAINKNEDYAMFYNKLGNSCDDIIYKQVNSLKYMAKFYSADDTLLVDEKQILELPVAVPFVPRGRYESFIKALCIQDSLYQFIVADTTLKQLHYSFYGKNGNLVAQDQVLQLSFPVQPSPGEKLDITSMRTSNLTASGYSIILTSRYAPQNGTPKDIVSQYNFSEKGIPSGNVVHSIIDVSSKLPFSGEIFRDEQGAIYTTAEKNGDVYLEKYNNLQLVQSSLINDDVTGCSQYRPVVAQVDNEKYFVTYEDAAGIMGRYVDKEGNPIGQIYKTPGKFIQFFKDGRSLITWGHKNSGGFTSLGFVICDKDFNILRNDSLENISSSNAQALPYIFSDGSFIIVYRRSGGICTLRLYDNSGLFVKSKTYPCDAAGRFEIMYESDSTFSVTTGNGTLIYNSDLSFVYKNQSISTDGNSLYLKNGMVIKWVGNDTYWGRTIFNVYSALNNSGGNSFDIYRTLSMSGCKCFVLNDEVAGMYYLDRGKYWLKLFGMTADIRTDEMAIIKEMNGNKQDMTVTVNGNSVLFAWADSRTKGEGYNIYVRKFTRDEITEVKDGQEEKTAVPNEFSLAQNYPNPFNPVTTIEYSLPEESNVSLIVYDMLGREVKTIARGVESAGSHRMSFDASGISSGVYIYTLQTGGGRMLTRKMVVMK